MKTLTGVILATSFLFSGEQNLSAQNTQSPSPQKESLQFRDRVSQHGITWTFTKQVPVGRFVNGDYYVVGEATVNSVSPKAENGQNGSVLNLPTHPGKSGFDARVRQGRYSPGLRASLPIHMKPGDSLISTASVEKMEELPAPAETFSMTFTA